MNLQFVKLIRFLSWIVVILTTVNIICFFTYCAVIDNPHTRTISPYILQFSKFPFRVKEVYLHLKNGSPTFMPKDMNFSELNKLEADLYAINAFWNSDASLWNINLFNLKNDSILFQWNLDAVKMNYVNIQCPFENAQPRNCILQKDTSLIVFGGGSPNLWKIDARSNVIWSNHSLIFDHSLNLDKNNDIWACTYEIPRDDSKVFFGRVVRNVDNEKIPYPEDFITKVDGKTGKVIFKKGISEILLENGYKNFVYGYNMKDPTHLNDIEPVLEDSEYWKEGDLFISLRHASLVFLYRPSTNNIIKLIFGPFLNQHDVDIFSNHEISVFNNNFILNNSNARYNQKHSDFSQDSLLSSEIIIYDFEKDSFRTVHEELFQKEKIYTKSQGLHQFLSNGDVFIESQNSAKIYIIRNNKVTLRKQMKTPIENFVYAPQWMEIFEQNPLVKN